MSSDDDIPEPDRVEGAPHPRMAAGLFGQDAAEATFLQAFNSKRLHHGWLISGPRGVGKATLAWRIARFLVSQPVDNAEALLPRPAATSLAVDLAQPLQRRIAALSEPRIFLCRRPWDAKAERLKQDITVDEVRKVKGFFNLSAADGGRRVVIVDAADEMNNSAANALLKILEEPPENATLLLVSHRPLSLLPTIRSRCRTLACRSLLPDDLAQAMQAAGFAPDNQTEALATLAAGSVGEAIRLLADDGVGLFASLIRLFSDPKGRMDRGLAIALAESCTGKAGQPRYDMALRLLSILLHRLATSGVSGPPQPPAHKDEAAVLARLSASPIAARQWAELAQLLAARAAHGRAVNLDPASVILDMLLKIDQLAATTTAA